MINLVDADTKRELKAARLNVVLLTYCMIVAATLVSVVGLLGFSHWWLTNRIAAANATVTANNAQTAPYAAVKAQAAAFSQDLGKTQSVFTNRSHYAAALLNIAASLPAGASVSSLALSPTFVTTPIDISAVTPTDAAAFALKDKLSASPIYAKVTLDNVVCGGSSCRVAITATLKPSVFTPGATE